MKTWLILSVLTVFVFASGCGGPVPGNASHSSKTMKGSAVSGVLFLQVTYSPEKPGTQKAGNTITLKAISRETISASFAYSCDGSNWINIAENISSQPARIPKAPKIKQGIQYKWVLPAISSDHLQIKIIAASGDGRVAERIIQVKEVVDSFKPRSKFTFDPFSL